MIARSRFQLVLWTLVAAMSGMAACGAEDDSVDLDTLVGGGRVGGVSGAFGGVTSDPPDAGGSTGDTGGFDGSGEGSGDAVITDATVHEQLLRVMRRVSSTCQDECENYAACNLSVPESDCMTGCLNLIARVDRATPDTADAVSCARSVEDLWECVSFSFTCEDYFYASEGRFSRCGSQATDVTRACGEFGLTGLSMIEL